MLAKVSWSVTHVRLAVLAFASVLIGLLAASQSSFADGSNVISIWKPVGGSITSYPGVDHAANAFDIDGNNGEAAYLWAVGHPFGSATFAARVNANFLRTSYYRNQFSQTVSYNDRYVGLDIWHTENGV